MLFTTFIQPKSIFLFISIPYPNQVYDRQRKKHSVVIYVCCIVSCSEIFLSLDSVFQRSLGCTKKFFLVANYGGDFWQKLVKFLNFEETSAVLIFWLTPRPVN